MVSQMDTHYCAIDSKHRLKAQIFGEYNLVSVDAVRGYIYVVSKLIFRSLPDYNFVSNRK